MNLPHPGELRHKVSIGKTENAVNANGYPEATDTRIMRSLAASGNFKSKSFAGIRAALIRSGLLTPNTRS